MRLELAAHYGGGPAYWLDPDLDPVVIETAIDLLRYRQSTREDTPDGQ